MKTKRLRTKAPDAIRLNRRDALKLLGGGIIILLSGPETADAEQLPSNYLRIGPDESITLYASKCELGQGITTALAQIAAEEMDAPLQSFQVVTGDTTLCAAVVTNNETWGSLTISEFGPLVRSAAAKARLVLIKEAAKRLSLPEDRLITRAGFVLDKENETTQVSYGTLAGAGTISATLTAAPLKAPSAFTICGKPAIRIDAVEKVTGRALYAGDQRLPGMLYAALVRPPWHGAVLKQAPDLTAAQQVPGAQVVTVGSLIAVLHAQPDVAARACALIMPEYVPVQPTVDDTTIHDFIVSKPPPAPGYGLAAAWSQGNLTVGQGQSVLTRDETYFTPYVAHAPMEPHTALASYENGSATVWASTQAPYTLQGRLASVLGISSSKVRVITPYVGGAFGGKAYNNLQAEQAARLSKAVGKPVNVTWTREDEFFYDYFQSPCVVVIHAGLNTNREICFWDSKSYFTANYHMARNGVYSFPNHRTQFYGDPWTQANLPLSVGVWRGPGNSFLTFARESHIDTLAAAARMDPVEFRLNHIADTRAKAVLTSAAQAFGWKPASTPSGRGWGVACGENNQVFTCIMAEVAVDLGTGAIKVNRMLSAQDSGRAINPDGLRQQMEGSMMMGLGYSLSEEVHFQGRAVGDLNFHQYKIPRFSWMPKLETVVLTKDTDLPKGSGEPPVVAVGGATANAFCDATGLRANRLPITPERVLALLRDAPVPDLNPPEHLNDEIRLSWVRRPGLKLQKCFSLEQPIWEDVPLVPGQNSITLSATESKAFFRLAKL